MYVPALLCRHSECVWQGLRGTWGGARVNGWKPLRIIGCVWEGTEWLAPDSGWGA